MEKQERVIYFVQYEARMMKLHWFDWHDSGFNSLDGAESFRKELLDKMLESPESCFWSNIRIVKETRTREILL